MNLSELITLYFERSNALQSLWTLYVVIIGGLLAFSSMRQRPDLWTTALVSVLFLIFAFRNLGGIGDVTSHRLAIREAIHHAEEAMPTGGAVITATLVPPAFAAGRNVHVITDILVLATLWAIELRRRRDRRQDQFAGHRVS